MQDDHVEVVHVMKRQIVIHVKECIKIKAKVFDGGKKPIGIVTRIFGPISNPYALINFNEEISDYSNLSVRC